MALVVVCQDVEAAVVLAGLGAHVVLSVPAAAAAAAAEAAAAVRDLRCGPGRVAVLVGDPADEAVSAAARAMALELFGQEPCIINSVAAAYELTARSATVGAHPDHDLRP